MNVCYISISSEWIAANICPVLKGNPNDPSNYHPISLTITPCCRITDILITSMVLDSRFSCETQLISLVEDISHAMDG